MIFEQTDRAIDLARDANASTQRAVAAGEEALKLAKEAAELAIAIQATCGKLATYFANMAQSNDMDPTPGNGVYSGAQAFRHAAELVAMLARGEKITGL